ncbi:uncharacterized protein LOC116308069 [Actinia tenebrosa]|uniref:Uncharacterized protein LOC116308069 n=1 Tax=Actinia tenebrosa TaxID=6105 RepID=A0A6P8J2V7_ACTTE|nr:uncharacterized protein LOC116308069 [Actinia tenebrosa]
MKSQALLVIILVQIYYLQALQHTKAFQDLEAFNKRSSETETRFRRSGACAEICIHRCLPSCNLACCVERPIGVNRHMINKMEVAAAKKIAETGSKKSILGSKENQLYVSKEEMEKGTTCDKKCLIHCDPSCKFKCCIRVPRG